MKITFKRMLITIIIIAGGVVGDEEDIEADRVSALPEQPSVGFKQYAGYITVDRAKGSRLFYWFIEANELPEQKPLILWLNGGGVVGDEEDIEADRVSALPEQPSVGFKQYAGYITVDRAKGSRLFYWFIEANELPEQKPLILWLNGGPGCSSVGYGALEEIGPFYPTFGNFPMKLNKNSWNQVANLLFLDSPVGVGFSNSFNTSEDMRGQDDNVTAMYSYTFLNIWFKKFSDYKTRDFYIVGESYAGHYNLQLSKLIYDRNMNIAPKDQINLRGIAIGNPDLDYESTWIGMVQYAWSHALISDGNYDNITQHCDFSIQNTTNDCDKDLDEMLGILSSIDRFSLYTPTCPLNATTNSTYSNITMGDDGGACDDDGYDPCRDNYIEPYMNRVDVQKAFHAISNTDTANPQKWFLCNYGVFDYWNFDPAYSSVLYILKELALTDLRIWIYSGDTDARLPVTSTRLALKKLGLKIKEDWTAWVSNQVIAGWTMVFEGGLRFATIRGAGHDAPEIRGVETLQLITHFLNNTALPTNPLV